MCFWIAFLLLLGPGAPDSASRGGRAWSAEQGTPAPAAPAGQPADSAAADTLPMRLARVAVVGEGGTEERRLVEPAGVAVDAFGQIFVTDAAQNRVQLFDARGRWITGAGTLGSDPGQLRRPGAVASLGHFGVAVLDRENWRVVTYDLHGRLAGTLVDLADPSLTESIGRVEPVTLAADRGGAVYVADADRDRLLVFDFSGRYVRSIGGYGTLAGSFRGLSGVAVAPRGELAAADRLHGRIQRIDAGGRVLGAWSLPGGPSRGALAVAVDDSERVAVADEDGGRVWVFDRTGRLLAAGSGFASPRSLAFAPDGTLLVAEAGAGRVCRLTLEVSRGARRG